MRTRFKSISLATGEMDDVHFDSIIAEINTRAKQEPAAPLNGNYISFTGGMKVPYDYVGTEHLDVARYKEDHSE
ncbi:MAG: hypothetical protein Q7S32_00055 [bacterium]|nr:hypothetical protein [bacterium]